MAPKRPAPMELTVLTAAEAANKMALNSQRAMRNRAVVNTFQHQQQHHQQKTYVKSRTMSSAAMTSTSSTTTTSAAATTLSIHSKREGPLVKHWQDELMEFSTQIARQAHFTLARIANYFRANGMKFDTNFRNHFLYISNNRAVESYDSFLIGLPQELKSENFQAQRPNTDPNTRPPPHIDINGQQLLGPPAKRKCIENGTTQAANDPVQSKQVVVAKKDSTVRLSKSMSKIGPQIRIQKLTSTQKLANVPPPALNISVATTTTTTTTATTRASNQLKIKNVKSLHQSAAATTTTNTITTANNTLNNDDLQKQTSGLNVENGRATGSIKKIRVVSVSKIPGRQLKMLVAVTPTPVGQVNAHSTPNKPVTATKLDSMPEDPLRIDSSTTELTIEPNKNVRPAFVKEVTLIQKNKQLSTSLPLMTVPAATATPGQSNGIVTRSRNINSEHPKKLYKCDSCAFTTEVEQNLMRHNLVVHTGDKPQICQTCKKRFPRKPLLLAHMREHHYELHSDLAYWDTNTNSN